MRALRTLLRRQALRLAGSLPPDRPPAAIPTGRPPRVLVLQPDHLGDVLLAAPALAALRAALPGATLHYLVGPWSAAVAERGPLGHAVSTLPFPGFTRAARPAPWVPYLLLARSARRLLRADYDAALVLRPDHWWGALLARTAAIPRRYGLAHPDTRPLLTHALPLDPLQHATHRALTLVRAAARDLGGTSIPDLPTTATPLTADEPTPAVRPAADAPNAAFRLTADDHEAAERLLAASGLGDARPVLLHPSSGAALKSWPVGRWVAVADALTAAGRPVVLSGGPGDEALLEQVRARMATPPAAVSLAPPLAHLAALLRRCAAAVGPDSGVLHLAAAVGTPTVRLYGPAPPAVFGPWPPSGDQRVLLTTALACVPCGHLAAPPCGAEREPACMLALRVDDVLRALGEVAPASQGPRAGQP